MFSAGVSLFELLVCQREPRVSWAQPFGAGFVATVELCQRPAGTHRQVQQSQVLSGQPQLPNSQS